MRIGIPFASGLAAILVGCTLEGFDEPRGCTLELRANYCVSVNGSSALPDSVKLLRIVGGHTDTVSGPRAGGDGKGICFHETTRAATLRVLRGDAVLAEKTVGPIPSKDGCHIEDTTINVTYRVP